MKKILLFSMCGGIFLATLDTAFADKNCTLYRCGGNDSINASADNIGDQCYYCNDGYAGDAQCGDGDVVGRVNIYNEITDLQQCHTSTWNDSWSSYNPGVFCNNSPVKKLDAENAYIIYSLDGGKKTTGYRSGDDTVLKSGHTACIYVKCNDGYIPDSAQQNCIPDTRNPKCVMKDGTTYPVGKQMSNQDCKLNSSNSSLGLKSTEHLKNNAQCNATCVSDGWNITLGNDSCATNYEPDSNKKQCVKSQAAIAAEQNAAAAEKKKRCEESGGTWAGGKCTCDSQKNLVLTNGVCDCLDSNYRREGMECVLTDVAALERECRAATGTYWNTETKRCECTMDHYIFQFGSCKIDPVYENCMKIRDATWNVAQNRCVCNDTDKELNDAGTACVETPEAREAREAEEQRKRTAAATQAISSAKKKLESLAEDFDQTVWKDAEGKFNTSRLASDSVAAVVLGTAGGLITSNVVKKNQVKNGFEDIQCTIGGQVVADWGDQFRVGIK